MADKESGGSDVNERDPEVAELFNRLILCLGREFGDLNAVINKLQSRLSQMTGLMTEVNGLIGADSLPPANENSTNEEWDLYFETVSKQTFQALLSMNPGAAGAGEKSAHDDGSQEKANEEEGAKTLLPSPSRSD